MSKQLKDENMNRLMDAMVALQSREEAYAFFEDLCTVNEMLSLSQRLAVAQLLREQRTYTEVGEQTGASTATISRVNRALHYGTDGYEMVLSRIEEHS